MTQVNVEKVTNSIVIEDSNGKVVVVPIKTTQAIEIITRGPAGPPGPAGPGILVNDSAKVDGSLVYYDEDASSFKADETTTKLTIVDGGFF